MRTGIATVSLRGRLLDKLAAAAAAGFDGVEVFDNDLVAAPVAPSEVASRCADLGLSIDLFQPVRDVEGVPPMRFEAVLHRLRTKLDVAAELGAPVVLVCSTVDPAALDDRDLSAEQLSAAGDLAADRGLVLAYEALAWGRHVFRVADAWDVVRRADHPAVTLAVDTFHVLARGDDATALAGVPGERIGFLQVADAPLLDMGVLEWSRHFRCFPGQGVLDVAGLVAAVVGAGYAGPLSLEVFSDVVREADPGVTARDAHRSLVHLEDQVARRLESGPAAADLVRLAPPPTRVDPAFVELADPAGGTASLLGALGFAPVARHRTKPVTRWRQGGAEVVVNAGPAAAPVPRASAVGLRVDDVGDVAARAKALRWPEVDRTRGDGEAVLPGVTSPSGLHVFVSAPAGESDDWLGDFAAPSDTLPSPWGPLDHVGVAVDPDRLAEEAGFLRTVLGLEPAATEEFIEPQGRLLSRALRPAAGDLRVVLNADHRRGRGPVGITQLAFACDDVLAAAAALRGRGVPMLRVPDNYYVDLDARFGLAPERLEAMRAAGALYDADASGGELLHAYTDVLATGFYVELVERRGGYDGYGSASTHVRLAAQRG